MRPYITRDDLVQRFTARRVDQLFDDDGSGRADGDPLVTIIAEASARAHAILAPVYTGAEISALSGDPAFRGAVAEIAMALAGRRRAEFQNDQGDAPYTTLLESAGETLRAVANATLKLEGGGGNARVGGGTNRRPRSFVFATSRDDPRGPGGY